MAPSPARRGALPHESRHRADPHLPDGLDLPLFAAFVLLADDDGTEALRRYYRPCLELARSTAPGSYSSPTWRASPRWAAELGIATEEPDQLSHAAIALREELRDEHARDTGPIVISGCIGPMDDGHDPAEIHSAAAAQDYDRHQIGTFAETAADMVAAITMTLAEEAVGIARAASEAGIPPRSGSPSGPTGACRAARRSATRSSRRRRDGRRAGLPHARLRAPDALRRHARRRRVVGRADPGPAGERLRESHAELDEATELDDGDPADLGARFAARRDPLPRLTVLGGCCGTDDRHVREACLAWSAAG